MNRASINFGFQFVCDGSSGSVSVNMTTGPVYYNLPALTQIPTLNGVLSLLGTTPYGLAADTGLTVTSFSILLGVLTVNFTGASTVPPNTVCSINGTLMF